MNRKSESDETGDTVVMPDRQLEQLPPSDDETRKMPVLTQEDIDRMLRGDRK